MASRSCGGRVQLRAQARTRVARQQLPQPRQRILAHALAVVPALPQQLLRGTQGRRHGQLGS